MDVKTTKNIALMLMLSVLENDGDVLLKLTPRERTMVLDALAMYSAGITHDPEISIFTSDEIDALGNKISNL